MKKTIKIAALLLVLSMTVFMFAACGKTLSGTYKADAIVASTTIEFNGKSYKSVTDAVIGNNIVEEGKYEIDEDAGTITFTYEVDGEEKTRTEDFVEGTEGDEEYIKIGVVKYIKQ